MIDGQSDPVAGCADGHGWQDQLPLLHVQVCVAYGQVNPWIEQAPVGASAGHLTSAPPPSSSAPASIGAVGVPASEPGRLGRQLWIHSCSTEKARTLGWGRGAPIVLGGGMS